MLKWRFSLIIGDIRMRQYATALLLGALLGGSDSNNPSAIGVTLSTTSTLESAGNLTITAELSRASDNDLELSYQTVDGTALAGSDYTATSGTVNLAAGELQTTINIPLIDDDTYECAETFSVTVSAFHLVKPLKPLAFSMMTKAVQPSSSAKHRRT